MRPCGGVSRKASPWYPSTHPPRHCQALQWAGHDAPSRLSRVCLQEHTQQAQCGTRAGPMWTGTGPPKRREGVAPCREPGHVCRDVRGTEHSDNRRKRGIIPQTASQEREGRVGPPRPGHPLLHHRRAVLEQSLGRAEPRFPLL